MKTSAATVTRAAVIGAATGGRTTAGVTAVVLTTPVAERRRGLRRLGHPGTRRAAAAFAAGELVVDLLPVTPSRTEPAGLGLRCLTAAGSAAALARRLDEPAAPAAGMAVAAAVAAAFAGVWWRANGAPALGLSTVSAALLEDAVVAALAVTACRGT